MLKIEDLKPGNVYEAKHPRSCKGMSDLVWNDRQIRWVGSGEVCYDCPAVKPGKGYPVISVEKFIKWAGKDITEEMPEGEWRPCSGYPL